MGNACAIFHKQFDLIYQLTNNYQQAVFLDKCIYWWQISKYTLGKNKIFFTRPYEQMATEARISESSVNRYLKDFEEKGYIEKITKLSACNKGEFKVIKRTYIHISEKLLSILNIPLKEGQGSKPNDSVFLEQPDIIDNVTVTESIYKVKDHNQDNNNTVRQGGIVNNSETPTISQSNKPSPHTYPIEPIIGERITERLKNYIKGMLNNVQQQHAAKLSDPNKIFAEVIFSVTQDVQWPGVDNAHHRVNIIAKLLRENSWKTPKGFYNHWDVGQLFRKKEQQRFALAQTQKTEGGEGAYQTEPPLSSVHASKNERFRHRFDEEYRYSKVSLYERNTTRKKLEASLNDILQNLQSEESYLNEIRQWALQKKSSVNQALIDTVASNVARLYEEKQKLIDEIASHQAQAA
jgi:DNA-binding Lrp family transcriptional regulator